MSSVVCYCVNFSSSRYYDVTYQYLVLIFRILSQSLLKISPLTPCVGQYSAVSTFPE
jgi:hypothetical protein